MLLPINALLSDLCVLQGIKVFFTMFITKKIHYVSVQTYIFYIHCDKKVLLNSMILKVKRI